LRRATRSTSCPQPAATSRSGATSWDVKLLREVDAADLERWEPVLKVGFPLPRGQVARVFDALGVHPPPLTRDAYTLEQFLAGLVEPSDAVRVVRVHKRRVHYTVGGCMAELTDVEADGRASGASR
jgi:exopolyphosphatase/guanosine-5'-triphosphate,3'-diphosphate pyrophosphatase